MKAHLLARRGSESNKIKTANEKGATVLNLVRLQKLLVGELTFKTLSALPSMTKEMLKADAYKMAVATRE